MPRTHASFKKTTPTTEETDDEDTSDDGSQRSSPVEDRGRDDYDHEYAIRLVPMEKYTMQEVIVMLEEVSDRWVVSEEIKPHVHYHIVICCDYSMSTMRTYIREFLRPFFADATTNKFSRGFGNAQYNSQEVKDLDAAVSYVLKQHRDNPDFKFKYVGFTDEYIENRKQASYLKKPKDEFKVEFYKLREDFVDIKDYMTKYVQLCSKYERMCNVSHAYSYAISAAVAKDPSFAAQIVDSFLRRI